MPRSITGMPLRRRTSRIAALLAAPAAAAVLLSGCSAGQVSQTDTMVPPVPGVNVTSKSGLASLLDVQIKYNSPQGYPVGSTAPLRAVIINNSVDKPLVLTGATAFDNPGGTSIGSVMLAGGAASIGANPSGAPSASATSRTTPAPSPSGSHLPSAAASPSPTAATAPVSLTIPPNSFARLDPDSGAYLAIVGVKAPLQPGSNIFVTFTFQGEEPVETPVPFGTPLSPVPRIKPSETGGEH